MAPGPGDRPEIARKSKEEDTMSMITLDKKGAVTVKVVTMGKGVANFIREEPFSLGTLLHELGVNGQMDVRVNGATVDKSHRLADGDQVLIVPKIRGGSA
jgi:sulfur carrier protein ThiS